MLVKILCAHLQNKPCAGSTGLSLSSCSNACRVRSSRAENIDSMFLFSACRTSARTRPIEMDNAEVLAASPSRAKTMSLAPPFSQLRCACSNARRSVCSSRPRKNRTITGAAFPSVVSRVARISRCTSMAEPMSAAITVAAGADEFESRVVHLETSFLARENTALTSSEQRSGVASESGRPRSSSVSPFSSSIALTSFHLPSVAACTISDHTIFLHEYLILEIRRSWKFGLLISSPTELRVLILSSQACTVSRSPPAGFGVVGRRCSPSPAL
mmetsp:Transcript_126215/g.363038  ORF Transcript_126215/g.363038 Transcript_126215/m.363038 type:complete len:272 (+) Transcript_126215:1027-1842(+)